MQCDYQYDFIYKEHTDVRIIVKVPMAIGIGHGAPDNYRDRLWHTFSNENKYVASQGTTTNLMDYNGTSTDLYKYQWDYIHNPEFVIFRGDDEEGEFIHGIKWIGNFLWGLAPDEQESQIEKDISLFNHIYERFDNYFTDSKTRNLKIELDEFNNWTVRSASHQGIAKKVYEGVKSGKPDYTLNNKGIYLETDILEGVSYKVAVYSANEKVSLNQNIRINNISELRNNTLIKVGYTDNYGLIAFYDTDGKVQMVFQLIGESMNSGYVIQWLNYLTLLLPAGNQQIVQNEKSLLDKLNYVKIYALARVIELWGNQTEEKAKPDNNDEIEQVISEDCHVVQEPRECLEACKKNSN